jgi:hypothetical protein
MNFKQSLKVYSYILKGASGSDQLEIYTAKANRSKVLGFDTLGCR